MKTFNVYGRVTLEIDMDIEAESPEDAETKAKELLADRYNLTSVGNYHDPGRIEYDVHSSF